MKTATIALSSALALITFPALANVTTGTILGTTEDAIRAALEQNGYTVEKIEIEGSNIEIDALLNGAEIEFEVLAATGEVLRIETEDDDK